MNDAQLDRPRTLSTWSKEIHLNAVNHGWWDDTRSFPEIIALVHSELSEALEEYRNGRPMLYYPCRMGGVCIEEDARNNNTCGSKAITPDGGCSAQSDKPEGIAIELADAIIRILDYCGHAGIDMDAAIRIKHQYNLTRSYRHGGKAC